MGKTGDSYPFVSRKYRYIMICLVDMPSGITQATDEKGAMFRTLLQLLGKVLRT